MNIPPIFLYWGKSDAEIGDQGLPAYHPLVFHSLDVAAVAFLLLQANPRALSQFSTALRIDEAQTLATLTFFVGLHDLGKFSQQFQAYQPELRKTLLGRPVIPSQMGIKVRHDQAGLSLWTPAIFGLAIQERWFWKGGDLPLPERALRQLLTPLVSAVTGHHGEPTKSAPDQVEEWFPEPYKADALAFTKLLARQLAPAFTHVVDEGLERDIKTCSWSLAGLTMLSDWIGSSRDWFPYQSAKSVLNTGCLSDDPLALMEYYWTCVALPQAQRAIRESGAVPPRATLFSSIAQLFQIERPTDLQQTAATLDLHSGPQLFFLEEATGGGKTEAALILAHRLLNAGAAQALYFALPTMATANAMYHRLTHTYHRMFESDAQGPASLLLTHANAAFTPAFARSVGSSPHSRLDIEPVLHGIDISGQTESMAVDLEQETASAWCNAWLADGRKRSLLGAVGVGTIDQLLLAVMPRKHQSLRLWGASRSVLIVDEVHAYDSYMTALLQRLLLYHAALGGSAIIMSATLPQTLRHALTQTWQNGMRWGRSSSPPGEEALDVSTACPHEGSAPRPVSVPWPLLTRISTEGITELAIKTRPDRVRTLMVQQSDDLEQTISHLLSAVSQGQCACWIRNTVYDAVAAYKLLKERLPSTVSLHLFHARFTLGDRLTIEGEVLERFGPESQPSQRAGQILIATQVVEQSLDLDFDVLVSDLAPIELLIQRAGRLHRHDRDASGLLRKDRTEAVLSPPRAAPLLWIYGPLPHDDVDEKWYSSVLPKASFVYPDHANLWLSARILQTLGCIQLPGGARTLIEAVYDPGATFPQRLCASRVKAQSGCLKKESAAYQNLLSLQHGYERKESVWEDDRFVMTRMTEDRITLRLMREESGKLVPWARDGNPEDGHGLHRSSLGKLQHRWSLSEVSVPNRNGPKMSAELETRRPEWLPQMLDKARYCIPVLMREISPGVWSGSLAGADERRIEGRYSREKGWGS